MDRGADVNARDDYNATALTRAAEYGYGPIVRVLLERGANPSPREERNMTAIELAEDAGHADIAELIHAYLPRKSFLKRAVEQLVGPHRR